MKHFIGLSLIAPVLLSLACPSAVSAADGDEVASPVRAVRSTQKAEVPNFSLLDYHGKMPKSPGAIRAGQSPS